MKSYTVEELRELYKVWRCNAVHENFHDWLEEKQKADDLHPIAKIVKAEMNGILEDWQLMDLSASFKAHDLRLWPEVTNEMVEKTINYCYMINETVKHRDRENPSFLLSYTAGLIHWLRDTFAVPTARGAAKGKE
jgi:hypothetical protein